MEKEIEQIKNKYKLACDGWIPIQADDWDKFVNAYDKLLKENKRIRKSLNKARKDLVMKVEIAGLYK